MLGTFGTFGTFKLLLSLSGMLRISLIFAILALLTKVGIFTFSVTLWDIYLCVIHVAWRHTHNSGQDPSYSGVYLWVTRTLGFASRLGSELARWAVTGIVVTLWRLCQSVTGIVVRVGREARRLRYAVTDRADRDARRSRKRARRFPNSLLPVPSGHSYLWCCP